MLLQFPAELVEEALLYLSQRDLIQVVKVNRRLYGIFHNGKSPLRHRMQMVSVDLVVAFRARHEFICAKDNRVESVGYFSAIKEKFEDIFRY